VTEWGGAVCCKFVVNAIINLQKVKQGAKAPWS
jgi:hypothetical protein